MPKPYVEGRTKRITQRVGSYKIGKLRILPKILPKKSKIRIFGFKLGMIEKQYQEYLLKQFPSENVVHSKIRVINIRFYEVPGNPSRFIVKGIIDSNLLSGYQELHEILSKDGKLQFKGVGIFSGSFVPHREITDESLKGKGLGSAALRSSLALEKKSGRKVTKKTSSTTSTLLLFLRNNFKINWKPETIQNIKILSQRSGVQIKNEEDLIKVLQKSDTPEYLNLEGKGQLYINLIYRFKKNRKEGAA